MSHASNDNSNDDGAATSAGSSSSSLPDSYEIVCGPVNGYDGVSYRMRSVLMHPVGLPLLSFFHDHDHGSGAAAMLERSGRARIRRYFPELVKHTYTHRRSVAYDRAFADSYADFERIAYEYKEWRRRRKDSAAVAAAENRGAGGRTTTTRPTKPTKDVLVRIFKDKILAPFASRNLLAFHKYVVFDRYDQDEHVSVDLLIQGEEDGSVAMLMEFGMDRNDDDDDETPPMKSTWWATAGRAVRYLRALPSQCNADSDAQFTGPVLLAAVQVATNQKIKEDAAFHSGLLGVFLCVPSTSSSSSYGQEYRMALMYRAAFDSLPGLTKAIGKTLRAVEALVDMLKEAGSGVRSLGHNSCRVGNMVLRAYDTRFGYSDARPDLYEEPELAPGTELVCRIGDRNVGTIATSVPGGTVATATATPPAAPRHDGTGRMDLKLRDRRRKVHDKFVRRKWMWEFAGEIVVLATPFYEGRHYATSPKEFVPVIRFLQRMHHLGCVHGDVRCANIVFGAGVLIDLDMGGRLSDNPRYPDGYQCALPDGRRLGRPGKPITVEHDWFAMLEVIFALHHIVPPKEGQVAWYAEEWALRRADGPANLHEVDELVDRLVSCLERAEAGQYRIRYDPGGGFATLVAEKWAK